MKTFEPQLLVSISETAAVSVPKKYEYKDFYYETKVAATEVAEVTHVEVKPPETATLDPAGNFLIRFYIDGDTKFISDPIIPCGKPELFAAIKEKIVPSARRVAMDGGGVGMFRIGYGVGDATKEGVREIPCVKATTIKFKNSIDVEVVPIVGTTAPFRINLYGYIYPVAQLQKLGVSVVTTEIYEPQRELKRRIEKTLPITAENWGLLPGGHTQNVPEIYTFVRRFVNSATIKKAEDYYLSKKDGKVYDGQNLYWYAGEIENEIIAISRLGVRYHADLKDACIMDKNGDPHPSRRIPAELLGYGWAFGCAPGRDLPKDFPICFYEVPELYAPFTIGGARDEEGGIVLRSNADISADAVTGVALGKRIILM